MNTAGGLLRKRLWTEVHACSSSWQKATELRVRSCLTSEVYKSAQNGFCIDFHLPYDPALIPTWRW